MKQFIFSILLFTLPAIILLAVVDYFYSKEIAKSNYGCIEPWFDLLNGKIDADVIVMGSSRSWVHVNPLILDSILCTNTYNIGMDGSAINRQVHKYNLFRKYNKKPKLIIQNIDYGSLGFTIGYDKMQSFPYMWNMCFRKEFEYEPLTIWEKYIPCYRYYRNCSMYVLSVLYMTKEPRRLTKGYQGMERKWNGTALNKVKTVHFNANSTTIAMFDQYLANAKAEGIKVVFVYAPLYIGAIQKMDNKEEMYATYQRIADKYNIPILDYMNMAICSDTTYFYNAMHLNKRGAEIYSDSLANDIKRLGILGE